ncbi:nuclear receptor coactivator 5 [Ictalurus furcatus]|uniref:nuclear receptor coactivator 5 n=1 Tax=Ictalurus furcatus TaxID=66913 RepID=UPI002350AF6A|nr:nuclear receptor coactivator 5 [Ictalurus furcatus]XP_053478983.1 nuclear receptor coactivator 5 [Ictalurus furcatus]
MSSWARSARSRRRLSHLSRGGAKPFRPFRNQPYPGREERKDPHHEADSFENVEQNDDYANPTDYKTYEPSPQEPNVSSLKDGDKCSALYQRFYQHFHGDGAKQPADCVVLSLNNQKLDYAKSLGRCLQERGLVVEMLYLQAESGLTRALKDVRSDGSPLCILVEQTNVALSSCTVIIFSESLKIHRNMPREQALDLVMVEYGRASGARRQCDPAEAAARASELSDDYLDRAKLERHAVPSATRHLLLLMAEGLHLYPEELDSIAAYVHNRQDHLQATSPEVDGKVAPETTNSLPAGLGNPPPLLSIPVGSVPQLSEHQASSTGIAKPAHGHQMSVPDSYPKTKPPPLLSLNIPQGSPQGPPPHDPPPPNGPTASQAPSTSRGRPPPRIPSASETRPILYGPPPLHGPPAPKGPPLSRALCGPSPPHGPPAPHSSSASQNPQPLRAPIAPRGPPASHGAHPPRPHGPHNGPHGFHIHGPPPHGPPAQNGPSGLRAPPPLLRNLRMRNPAGPAPQAL